MFTRRQAIGAVLAATTARGERRGRVRIDRLPEGAIQPQVAMGPEGIAHIVYYSGDPHAGNLLYVKSRDGGAGLSSPIAVNGQSGSAMALGTIRGAQLAVGKNDRIHVAWNGSGDDGPLNPDSGKNGAPMLYTRLNDSGRAFETPRSLMRKSFGLNGGGSIAADATGNVFVTWHAIGTNDPKTSAGEARRRVWLAVSGDDGRTLGAERRIFGDAEGACGCCGMKLHVGSSGHISALYRSAAQEIHRDIYLLRSANGGQTFAGGVLQKWEINACPMSSMDIAENNGTAIGAWETLGQIYWARLDVKSPVAAPGEGKARKHPRIAVQKNGDMLLVWTEGTAWQRGGTFAWQMYDRGGKLLEGNSNAGSIPVWSFAAPVARRDGGFSILV